MQNDPDTPDERLQRRRIRRWKRRGRILGPFLAVPMLLVALLLSVDLIEYQPQEEPDRLTDRPIRMPPQPAARPITRPNPVPTIPTGSLVPDASESMGATAGTRGDGADLNVTLPATRPPTPPYALGRP